VNVDLLLVPYDSARRGERLGAGPEHLVAAGLPAALGLAGHAVSVETIEPAAKGWCAEIGTAFALARALADRVRAARAARRVPVVLAGNCMSSVGVVGGLGAGTGVLWLDAHADFNTPDTTVGGFLDGMALATVTGRCWPQLCRGVPGFVPVPEAHAWLLGARDLDPLEEDALRRSVVHRVPARELGAGLAERIAANAGVARWYVHLDLDVLDPGEGRVNVYAAADGVSRDALQATLRALCAHLPVAALTLSAYDPAFDVDGRVREAAFGAVSAALDGLGAAE
jgi:arginase